MLVPSEPQQFPIVDGGLPLVLWLEIVVKLVWFVAQLGQVEEIGDQRMQPRLAANPVC